MSHFVTAPSEASGNGAARHRVVDLPMHPRTRTERPEIRGKFFYSGPDKVYAKGVTYGPFRPGDDGCKYHNPDTVRRDFAAMTVAGINAVRTYTVPPAWLLDMAGEHGLWVLAGVGLAGEQHVAFLDDRRLLEGVRKRCTEDLRGCACHPAILGYVIGNEIPAPIVRWHGRRRVERFLAEMYDLAKQQDPRGLVTYVNYPTTEYLQLPSVDFHSYNVYLEAPDRLVAYLARLQNLVGDKPLVMAEIGLDSLRNGARAQARSIEWQIRAAFAGGCAGAFVFSWTDEWHTGGLEVNDWKFGITDTLRRPKPALSRTRRAFAESPFPRVRECPKVSVVVCTHNGGRTIQRCLEGVAALRYPNFEVIVVDDGSTDSTAEIASRFEVRLIRTVNRGLSVARNTGMRAATGTIIAYIDDDAWPDPHWLDYLVHTFSTADCAAVGGPNLPPPDDGAMAQCVANCPGGPTHILLTDQVAEHIPGCNMAFRAERLREIAGFDPQFRIAGDDVDVCWRFQKKGYTLGFHPAALVWHRRRGTVKAYLRQQFNYGSAEALLEAKWPEKYNAIGHVPWRGRLYGGGSSVYDMSLWPSRVYHGVWSSQAYQSLYNPAATFAGLPLMPEWYLLGTALAGLALLAPVWPPLLLAVPLLLAAVGLTSVQALRAGARASFQDAVALPRRRRLMLRGLVAALHVLQPFVRLWGRLGYGLTPWRRYRRRGDRMKRPLLSRTDTIWSESWEASEQRLASVEQLLQSECVPVHRGHEYDEWDLEVRGGLLASARTLMAVEQYPGGRQLIRLRSWASFSGPGLIVMALVGSLAVSAHFAHAPVAAAVLGALALLLLVQAVGDGVAAINCLAEAIHRYRGQVEVQAAPPAATEPHPTVRAALAQLSLPDPNPTADSPAWRNRGPSKPPALRPGQPAARGG